MNSSSVYDDDEVVTNFFAGGCLSCLSTSEERRIERGEYSGVHV